MDNTVIREFARDDFTEEDLLSIVRSCVETIVQSMGALEGIDHFKVTSISITRHFIVNFPNEFVVGVVFLTQAGNYQTALVFTKDCIKVLKSKHGLRPPEFGIICFPTKLFNDIAKDYKSHHLTRLVEQLYIAIKYLCIRSA
jgi:hypothetical protein